MNEIVSKYDLDQFKEYVTNIYVIFNQLNKENRDKKSDYVYLNSLRNNALYVFDKCNKLMMSAGNKK
jgi:hypothetical protein